MRDVHGCLAGSGVGRVRGGQSLCGDAENDLTFWRRAPCWIGGRSTFKPWRMVLCHPPDYAPDGPLLTEGAVPLEGIIGTWEVGDGGRPTGGYWANERYGGFSSSPLI